MLVERLAEGLLDIIGDVHGEREALETLIDRLGYSPEGLHPKGRRLVFVGDLCDRGPDSPAVIRLVQSWVTSGRAQVIAGNHELNLLRGERKHGNHWFYGTSYHADFGDCVAISAKERGPMLDFFRSLPIVLERSDLRVVHAAWIDSAINACRTIDRPLDAAYQEFDAKMTSDPGFRALKDRRGEELHRLATALADASKAPAAVAIGPFDEFVQMGNPIRITTSGVERATQRPFFASGKWRYVDRVAWWHEYAGRIPVLFGHYWRWWNPGAHQALSKGEPQLFADDCVAPFMAEHHSAFCIDFSVGSRYKERRLRDKPPYQGRLAAMRWPERTLVFDGAAPG